jgi:hypothetical protein
VQADIMEDKIKHALGHKKYNLKNDLESPNKIPKIER